MPNALRAAMAALLLTGCAGLTTAVPDTGFATGAEVQKAVASYYRDHAVEYDSGPCYRPYFDAVTRVDVVEESAEALVLDVRYTYLDRLRDDEDDGGVGDFISRRVCWGAEARQFTLTKEAGAIQVADMTGPVRSGETPTGNWSSGSGAGVSTGSGLGVSN